MKVILIDNLNREYIEDNLLKDNLSESEARKMADDYLENGSEIISLIDDLLCGVFAAFIWIFILNMIDLFS